MFRFLYDPRRGATDAAPRRVAGNIYIENGVTFVETWRYDTFVYGFRYIPPILTLDDSSLCA